MPNSPLLSLLADGEFRSGQELADALGISRTAVWKQVNRLTEQGIEVESIKGRGYRLPGGLELLDEEQIRDGLTGESAALVRRLVLLERVDSTNAEVIRRLEAGEPGGLVVSAEQQTAGRGRRGRTWVSPYGRNLYLSLAWEFSQGAAALEGLSLAVGVAVAQGLSDLKLPPVQLKWPNDVLFEGKKLGGVLLEMTGDAAGQCQVIVGIGLNLAMPAAAAETIDQAWTDLETLAGRPLPRRNAVLAAVLNRLVPLVAGFEQDGFATWRQAWLDLDAMADTPVLLDTGSERMSGTARGVNERGALLLESTSGTRAVFGGEVSMRSSA